MTDLEMDLLIANARVSILEKMLAEYQKQISARKCGSGDGVTIKPDGTHKLDPCIYETTEIHRNVTVVIGKCMKCGNVDVSWIRQDDTIDEEGEQLG